VVLVDVEDGGGEQAAMPTAARAATDNAAYLIEVLLTRGTFQP
jgi:F0F1-type ATP synthase gamma subunit